MSNFSSPKPNRDFDLGPTGQQVTSTLDLRKKIVLADLHTQTNFTKFVSSLSLFRITLAFLLHKLKTPVIEQFAHRRRLVWSDLDKIKSLLLRQLKRCLEFQHNSRAIFFDNPHFRHSDLAVNSVIAGYMRDPLPIGCKTSGIIVFGTLIDDDEEYHAERPQVYVRPFETQLLTRGSQDLPRKLR
jgi:hypothetical protein